MITVHRMRPRIGLSVMLLETRREAIIDLAIEGDRLGYDGFFMPEAWAYDMTILLAEAAVRTTRIRLGTGIVSIWNRSAATMRWPQRRCTRCRADGSCWAAAPARHRLQKVYTIRRLSRQCRACAVLLRRCERCSAASASHWR